MKGFLKGLILSLVSLLFLNGSLLQQVRASDSIEFVAFGDAPYLEPGGTSMFEKLVQQVNGLDPNFVVHVGDFKGASECTDENFEGVYKLFSRFSAPFVYTPGDNEWTDCHRKDMGGFDPVDRLKSIRRIFFSGNGLEKNLGTLSQGADLKSPYIENRRWVIGEVLFSTFHVVGSDNNFSETDLKAREEFEGRNSANLTWLESALKTATQMKAKVMVFIFHADLRLEEKPNKAYTPFVEKLKEVVTAFGGPVLGVHGDFHKFIVDQPLKAETGHGFDWPISNFTRVQVFGAPDVRGVKILIEPENDQPFSIKPMPHIKWEYPIE